MRTAFLCVLLALGAGTDDELDYGKMTKGEIGKLPKTTKKLEYVVNGVYDEDLLIVVHELRSPTRWEYGGTFWYRAPDLTTKYKKNDQILLPDVYRVIGTKSIGGRSWPRIVKHTPK